MNSKLSKDQYYLGIAEAVAIKSTCLRRKYGAIIVKNDEIISTGYNGSPRGCMNCAETGCMREAIGIGKGDAYNLCVSVHAEQNAIISASRRDMIGSTIYIVGLNAKEELTAKARYADPSPCLLCHRMIINAGITKAVGMVTDELGQDKGIYIDITQERFMERMQAEYTKTINKMEMDMADPKVIENAKKLVQIRSQMIEKTYHPDYSDPNVLAAMQICAFRTKDRKCSAFRCSVKPDGECVSKEYFDCIARQCPIINKDMLGDATLTLEDHAN